MTWKGELAGDCATQNYGHHSGNVGLSFDPVYAYLKVTASAVYVTPANMNCKLTEGDNILNE